MDYCRWLSLSKAKSMKVVPTFNWMILTEAHHHKLKSYANASDSLLRRLFPFHSWEKFCQWSCRRGKTIGWEIFKIRWYQWSHCYIVIQASIRPYMLNADHTNNFASQNITHSYILIVSAICCCKHPKQ